MIAVLYFVLLQFFSVKRTREKETFSMRFLFFFSLCFGSLPYTLIATTSVQNGTEKLEKNDIETILIFYFCMKCIEKRRKKNTPFHFNSANSVFRAGLSGEDAHCP